jgi:nucleotide-binding universal stress UspA family protein
LGKSEECRSCFHFANANSNFPAKNILLSRDVEQKDGENAMLFRRILVPLDGSTRAEQALPAVLRIARALRSTVILVSVVVAVPQVSPGKFVPPEAYAPIGTDEELAEAAEYLKTVATSDQCKGIEVETHAFSGNIATTLLGAVETLHANLMVISSHSSPGLKRWVQGSIAHKLIRHCPVPLLILRDDEQTVAPEEAHPVHILLTLDGSSFAETALEPAAELSAELARASGQQGTLQILQVVDVPLSQSRFRNQLVAYSDADIRAKVKHADEQYLATITKRFTESTPATDRLTVTSTIATDPDVAETIVQTAEQGQVNMIVMATHGRGGVLHWALGSVTERVLHASKTPVLLIRPQVR